VVGDALGLGAGVALGQAMATQRASGLTSGLAREAAAASASASASPPTPTPPKADEIIAIIEKLAALHARGILTADEFATRKAELLKRLG
jgi:hypothetical protein